MKTFDNTSYSIGYIEGMFLISGSLSKNQLEFYFKLCTEIGHKIDSSIQEYYEKRK